MKQNIMLILSDQHGQAYTQMETGEVDTPQLSRIAGEGVSFSHCYCNAPLCVPSRMSFLSGSLPSELGIWNNDSTLPSDVPTIAHALGSAGYKTVLIGRMHFMGNDQNHGFDERLVGDITAQHWGCGGAQREDFGGYKQTTNRMHCLDVVGGGTSPVMTYDDAVFEAARAYLEKEREESEPLFLVVGFYGPHFPFVTEPALYEKYKKRFANESFPVLSPEDVYDSYLMDCGPDKKRHCKAAYCGQVERLDNYVGQLYDRFTKSGRPHVFLYTSDHGEQLGKRKLFGKQALYEDAIRVPLIAAGTGIARGRVITNRAVSLLDLSATLLSMGGLDFSWHRGQAIETILGRSETEGMDRPVMVQQILEYQQTLCMAEALIRYPYKAVRYRDRPVQVYNLEKDPEETQDIAKEQTDFTAYAMTLFLQETELQDCLNREQKKRTKQHWLKAWGREKRPAQWAAFPIPPHGRQLPVE